MMNLQDIAIIYLACGSPFGVYYFLNKRQSGNNILLKSLLLTIFWIPFAFRLLNTKVTKKLKNNHLISRKEKKLFEMQKYFENFLPNDSKNISLFELRETVERYSGLTYVISGNNQNPASHEKEIFKFNGNKNIEISALCLNRRNRKKLNSHQTQAREDFLNLLKILFASDSEQQKLGKHTLEFVKLLNDEKALVEIKRLINEVSQSFEESHVLQMEKDLWTSQKQKNAKQIP
ncbi:MAG: hypothetical protein ACR2J3_09160 [Aridibacter sp.]